MNCIVAVDKNWAIGYKNELLVSIPDDMRFFREVTGNKVVITGKNTLESFPGGQPLKNRVNIVITRKKDYKIKDAIVVNSIWEALEEAKKYKSEDVFVIGGASIYKQMLPYCDVAHVTKIDYAYQADTYFPNLDDMEDWILAEETEEHTYYDLSYTFCRYERKRQ
jgi:dihydrofolate reductase